MTSTGPLGASRGPVLLYIDSLKIGGAERITLAWARWLRDAGYPVLLLTRHGAHRDFYPLPAGIERSVEARDAAWLRRMGWFGFPMRLCRLRQLLNRLQPSLVLGITTLPAIKLLLASAGAPWPVLVSERNYPPAKPPARSWRWLRRLAYPHARQHLVQTQRTADWLVAHQGVEAQRCTVVPNPVLWPLPRFAPVLDPQSCLPAGTRMLLAVGTKPHQKGFDRLISAFLRLAEEHPAWHLVILGLDPAAASHHQAVADLLARRRADPLLRKRLHCPGPLGNVADWYAAADMFVLSSRYEGFPNVLLEAMASGCACLACACPTGPDEIVRHGHDGWLLPAEADAEQLAGGLRILMKDQPLRQRLGRNARAVIERFAEAQMRRRLLEALEPLVP
jgi:glycosyltransferase involved in cell wall biosynthesis